MDKKILLTAALLFAGIPVFAQQSDNAATPSAADVAAMEQHMKEMEERIIQLEGKVRMLQSAQAAPATPAAAATPTPAPGEAAAPAAQVTASQVPPPSYGGAGGSAAKALNPDISVIGDFIGAAGANSRTAVGIACSHFHHSKCTNRKSAFRPSSIPTPAAISSSPLAKKGVDLEEGYITFTALPAGFVVKGGKMRSAFGKVNTLHNHVLPWIDRPLVTSNLVGGEDGSTMPAFPVQRILPAPKGFFLEATASSSAAIPATILAAYSRHATAMSAPWGICAAYQDINESTNLDLGVSYARGHNDLGHRFSDQLFTASMPRCAGSRLRRSIYHSFVGRSEFIWSQRQQLPVSSRTFGFYTSADYQLGRRWFLGGRFDRSDRSRFANLTDKGGSVVLTYWPSEFSQIRGQYRHTSYAEA